MLINIDQLEKSEKRAKAAGVEEKVAIDAFDVADEAEVALHDDQSEDTFESEDNISSEDTDTPVIIGRHRSHQKVFTASIDNLDLRNALVEKAKTLSVTFSPTAVPSDREQERMLNGDDLVPEYFLRYALIAAKAVCRITVRNRMGRELGWATGFMIAPQLLLTNWHVFQSADFAINSIAEFDYTLDLRGEPVSTYRFAFAPELFFLSDKELDYAVVAVNQISIDGKTRLADFGYHRLIPEKGKIEEGEWITIIQHPGGQRRQYSIRDNEVIKKEAGERFLWYKSDTAQGSSGSPAFNDRFQVVALHHLGRAKRDAEGKYILHSGEHVSSLKGYDDSEVVWEANEGLRVSVLCASLADRLKNSENGLAKQLFATIDRKDGDIMSNALDGKENNQVENAEFKRNQLGESQMSKNNQSSSMVTINVPTDLDKPLHLSLGFGSDASLVSAQTTGTTKSEEKNKLLAESGTISAGSGEQHDEAYEFKMVEPFIDNDYSTRKGYDKDFLGVTIPLPTVTDKSLVSKMDDGKYVIPYEHFSVVVNKNRRLALFTASNVDGNKKARRPEELPSANYSRKGLSGLQDTDQEKWRTDPRIPELHQLPDKFYNKDRKAFDKGHIVRRDDVCWGKSYKQIKKANGDTYHTTNCSPQVNTFNQSQKGGIWGDLENYVLKQAEGKFGNPPEKYTIFAGPIFDESDEWFEGYDDRGSIRIQIPRKFWKMVVAQTNGELQVFTFLLEQDLQAVVFEEEFQVAEEWSKYLLGVVELQGMLEGIAFPSEIVDADQAGTDSGDELMRLSEIQRLK